MSKYHSFKEVLADADQFVEQLPKLSVGDVNSMVSAWTLAELEAASTNVDTANKILMALPAEALEILSHKAAPTGVKFKPGEKAKFAIVGVTNMRRRSEFMMLLVGMIAYLKRAVEERSTEDACEYYDTYYNREQRDLLLGFLDEMFEYNPKEHIDRISSSLHAPPGVKLTKHTTPTANIKIFPETNLVTDSTRKYAAGENKAREVERSSAEVEFPAVKNVFGETIKVKIDPPSDIYPQFFKFYNVNFDAIHKISHALFEEIRSADGTMVDNPTIWEHVSIYAGGSAPPTPHNGTAPTLPSEASAPGSAPNSTPGSDVKKGKKGKGKDKPEATIDKPVVPVEVAGKTLYPPSGVTKARLVSSFMMPMSSAQWQNTIMVLSPDNNKFFDTEEEAVIEMMKQKGSSWTDLNVIATNSTILTDSWYAGRRRVVTDDITTNSLFQRNEEAQKLYAHLNKKRVMKSKLREMIMNGPDAADFADYMREYNAANMSQQALDEQDEEQIMIRYREFKAQNVWYDRGDTEFMKFVRRELVGRDLNREPMTTKEQKALSRKYAESFNVLEVPNDSEILTIDALEYGGEDPNNAGPSEVRRYVETPDGMSIGAVRR